MPAAVAYTPDDKDLRGAASTERAERDALLDKAQKYYAGQHKKPLKVRPNQPDLNIVMNLFQMRVERRCDFLFRDFPDIELNEDGIDDGPQGEMPDEEWLEQAWQENGGVVFANELVQIGCLSGHPCVRVLPADTPGGWPKLRIVTNVITYWNAEDYKEVLWHEVEYVVGKTKYRQDILDCQALGIDGEWLILEYRSDDNGSSWFPTRTTPWDYPLPPIIDFQHWPQYGAYYGRSEATDLGLNDAINRAASQMNAIIRNHAFPKTIATGVTAAKVQETSVDSFWAIENANAKVYNLEMQSDLSTITQFINSLVEAYNTQGRTILLKGGPADFARVTNLGIRTAFMDMLNANRTLQQQYGRGIEQICRTMLMLAGKRFDYPMSLEWPDPLPENILEVGQVVQLERQMGMLSKQTGAEMLDLDWDQEQARLQAESESEGGVMERLLNASGSSPFSLPVPPGEQTPEDHTDASSKI